MISHSGAIFEVGESRALIGVRQKEFHKASALGLFLQFFHDLSRLPRIARSTVSCYLVMKQRFRGIDVSIHKHLNALLQLTNLVTMREIHRLP